MMSGVQLETCWAFSKLCNNKFYYKAASYWYFYWVIYDARIHEYQIYIIRDNNSLYKPNNIRVTKSRRMGLVGNAARKGWGKHTTHWTRRKFEIKNFEIFIHCELDDSGFEPRAKARFSRPMQTGSNVHPDSRKISTGYLFRGKAVGARCCPHTLLASRFRIGTSQCLKVQLVDGVSETVDRIELAQDRFLYVPTIRLLTEIFRGCLQSLHTKCGIQTPFPHTFITQSCHSLCAVV
jgi:hypothetical protein